MHAEFPPNADGPTCLSGRLVREVIDHGSKSERLALQLVLEDGRRMLLRRQGAHPIRDPVLEALEGQVLQVTGEQREGYFLVRHLTPLHDQNQ
ncbi:hypothetical protein [Roseateles terrae]|uniref:Uncharacterized protein n=1 Tax=Roseateles terrae TaxID=431060 RepID=A0ABR6GYV7_9BURK|nr:hypothetical protein [Roseateles terrae]MBB3197303.1 hypothetical protein [Roseateles terrae]OWQ83642.1 hypothetical protein CDN98_21575 [Roseateles terrae]